MFKGKSIASKFGKSGISCFNVFTQEQYVSETSFVASLALICGVFTSVTGNSTFCVKSDEFGALYVLVSVNKPEAKTTTGRKKDNT